MGSPSHLLTIPAVTELRVPQVCQADEDGLAEVALLGQGRVADGAAAAPRVQELLQCLADSTPWPGQIAPPASPPSQAGTCSFPGSQSWDDAETEGQTGLTCTRSGRRWLSRARYPSRLCSTGVCDRSRAACYCHQAHTTHLPGQGDPRGRRPVFPGVPEGTGLG